MKPDTYFTCSKCGRELSRKASASMYRKRRADGSGWDHWRCEVSHKSKPLTAEEIYARKIAIMRDENIG